MVAGSGGSTEDLEVRRTRWEAITDFPLMVAALVFLVVYAWPILDPGLPSWAIRFCVVTGVLVWALFVADYVVRVVLSRHRWLFVRRNLFGLAVIVLPMLRPLRLLQALTLLTLLSRYAGKAFRGKVILYAVATAVLVTFIASLAVLQAERAGSDPVITDFGDAYWWSLTTVTTVGYGDEYPTTAMGRVIASTLMVGGVALVGAVTATFASWLIERVQEVEDTAEPEEAAATREDVDALTAEVARLRALLEERDG